MEHAGLSPKVFSLAVASGYFIAGITYICACSVSKTTFSIASINCLQWLRTLGKGRNTVIRQVNQYSTEMEIAYVEQEGSMSKNLATHPPASPPVPSLCHSVLC